MDFVNHSDAGRVASAQHFRPEPVSLGVIALSLVKLCGKKEGVIVGWPKSYGCVALRQGKVILAHELQ